MSVIQADFVAPAPVPVFVPKGRGRPDQASALPDDAVVRILLPARSAMTSGPAGGKTWLMTIPRRIGYEVEPLMGWTSDADMACQIVLRFPTLEAAVDHAERLGLRYEVQLPQGAATRRAKLRRDRQIGLFSDATLPRLGLQEHRAAYREAMAGAETRHDPVGGGDHRSPMEIVRDATLTVEAKRSILMNWAFSEYQHDMALSSDGTDRIGPSRLSEIEQALKALEGRIATERGAEAPDDARRMALP
jgi:hypothetical protein